MQAILSQKIVYQYQAFAQATLMSYTIAMVGEYI